MLKKILLYGRTIRYLRWKQIFYRLKRKVTKPKVSIDVAPDLGVWRGSWSGGIRHPRSWFPDGRCVFLNEAGSLSDLGWQGAQKSDLWRYNQHYFHDLLANDAFDRCADQVNLVKEWIAANPAQQGGVGWEPYPTSLRVINWIKWLSGPIDLPADQKTVFVSSLATQIRWLMKNQEWHILGNHLFLNAKALVFAGVFFTGPEADTWLATGLKILENQIPEQILPDGGQFELSPMYHALAVEDILDLVHVAQLAPDRFGSNAENLTQYWSSLIPSMMDWLSTMCHPDGEISFFNDAAFCIAPLLSALTDYVRQLGVVFTPTPHTSLDVLAHSGYCRMSRGAAVVIADTAAIGPSYLPGHAHADSLSFEMSLYGQRLIVNGGTSIYGTDTERQRQRSTAAHATLVIENENSSEVWDGFRVARRAYPIDVSHRDTNEAVIVQGGHTGYRRLPGRPLHHRIWTLNDTGLLVTDTMKGDAMLGAALHFPLAPHWVARKTSDGVTLSLPDATHLNVSVISASQAQWDVVNTTWHPEFGKAVPAQKLVLELSPSKQFSHETRITWS